MRNWRHARAVMTEYLNIADAHAGVSPLMLPNVVVLPAPFAAQATW